MWWFCFCVFSLISFQFKKCHATSNQYCQRREWVKCRLVRERLSNSGDLIRQIAGQSLILFDSSQKAGVHWEVVTRFCLKSAKSKGLC